MRDHGQCRIRLLVTLVTLLALPAAAICGDWDDANRQFKQELTRYLGAREARGAAREQMADAQKKIERGTDREGKIRMPAGDLEKLRAIITAAQSEVSAKDREMDAAIQAAADSLRGFDSEDSVKAVAMMSKAVQESRHVAVAFGVLEGMDAPEALVEMASQLESTHDAVFARYLARALWRSADRDSRQAVIRALDDRDPTKVMGALDAISLADSGPLLDRAIELMAHKLWQVRVAALALLSRSIGEENEERIVQAAIARVAEEDGRVRADLHRLLSGRMGGAVGGDDSELWSQLWDNFKADRANGVLAGPESELTVSVPTYYGVPIYSKYIVFVLDTSGSMDAPHNIVRAPRPKDKPEAVTTEDGAGSGKDKKKEKKDEKKRKELDWEQIKKKIDLAKAELIRTLEELDEDVYFSIVTYNTSFTVLSPKLVPATKANKKTYIAAIEGLSAGGSTDAFFTAQLAGMGIGLTGPKKGGGKAGGRGGPAVATGGEDLGRNPDLKVIHANTIYFLTDGFPTLGSGTIMPEPEKNKNLEALLARFDSTKVVINTVGIGPHDNGLLNRIASMTGGTYVDLSR